MKSHRRYLAKLHNIPRPGTGCHSSLLGVANLGRLAGLCREKIFSDIRAGIPPGGSRNIPDKEIWEAIDKAFSGDKGGDYARRPAHYPVAAPKKADLQKILSQGKIFNENGLREVSPISLPDAEQGDPVLLLATLYEPHDRIWIGEHDEAGIPGKTIRTAAEWIDHLQNGGKAGPHIIPNPLSGGKGWTKDGKVSFRCDDTVAKYRFGVVEFDDIPLEDQCKFWSAINLHIVALIDSGGKSIHGWVDVQKHCAVESYDQWAVLVKDRLYGRILKPLGVDGACSNPSRLSRLPGHFRVEKGAYQRLLWMSAEGRRITP